MKSVPFEPADSVPNDVLNFNRNVNLMELTVILSPFLVPYVFVFLYLRMVAIFSIPLECTHDLRFIANLNGEQ